MSPLGTRRVLVTGGGSGIGRAVAEAILEAGGRVAVAGRRVELLDALAQAWPGRVVSLPADLAQPLDRQGLLARARDALGGLDGFAHCAGVVVHQRPGQITEDALRSQIEVNLVAPIRLGEEALEVLAPGGGMVFVASTAAARPLRTTLVYSAAKAGLLAALKVLALVGAERKIRANAVNPGVVDTDMIRAPRPDAPPDLEAQLAQLHPLGRLGQPTDVAQTVLHLLGAPWATGSAWTLDGGLLIRE